MSSSEDQLGLRLGAIQNRGLFPEHYLTERLPALPEFQSLEVEPLRAELRDIWTSERSSLETANEQRTEELLVKPALRALGFHYTVRPDLPLGERRREPDFALFLTEEERRQAERLMRDRPGRLEVYRRAAAIAEAKKWERPLEARRVAYALSEDPVAQIISYVSLTRAPWGILTNGRTWRLYARDADLLDGACYEVVDLVELLATGDPDEFRYFAAFFSASALRPDAQGRTFLDRVLEEGRANAVAVGDALERQVFAAVPKIAEGLLTETAEPSDEDLHDAFENSLVLLYRLLFCLHAEARGLLPLDNEHYRGQSLMRHKQELASARRADRPFSRHSDQLYSQLRALFRMVDRGEPLLGVSEYDGGLFAAGQHPFLESRLVPDDLLADALDRVYRVNGEFVDYRDLSVRHLGTIYERLLDFRLKLDGSLELERAPGRRETGSYFTPPEVVDLIVSRTVEPLLERRSQAIRESGLRGDDALEAFLGIRVLDAAMGSGHFLVAAAAYIATFVATDPSYDGELNRDEIQRRVVERCIYGVDVNPMAVELAKVSLWLATAVKDEPLTFLGNLRVGDSLVGADLEELLAGEQSLFGARLARQAESLLGQAGEIARIGSHTAAQVQEKERIAQAAESLRGPLEELADETVRPFFADGVGHMFHWELEFPEVFLDANGQPRADGGFDVVVGNPPYIRIQELGRELADFCRSRYETASGSFDAYVVFIERALELLSSTGRLGFIVPNKFTKLDACRRLRQRLSRDGLSEELIDFADAQVFEATNYTCILVLDKAGVDALAFRKLPRYGVELRDALTDPDSLAAERFALRDLGDEPWILVPPDERRVLDALRRSTSPLGEVTESIFTGLQTGADPIYIVEDRGARGGRQLVYSRASGREIELEPDLLHPLASGSDVEPYAFKRLDSMLLFPYRREAGHMGLLEPEHLERLPLTSTYLAQHENSLRARERGKMDHEHWYAYTYPKSLGNHDFAKVGVPRLCERLRASADADGVVYLDNVDVNGVLAREGGPSIWTLVVLLNSRVLDWVFRRLSVPFRGRFFSANKQFIAPLPIRIPIGTEATEVDELGKRLHASATGIGEERAGFLDWLGGEIGVPVDDLQGKTKLRNYERLELNELLEILRRNRTRLSVSPDTRALREAVDGEHSESVRRLTELIEGLDHETQRADEVVYDLYELTADQRALIEADYQDS